jgi:cell division protease FtsH
MCNSACFIASREGRAEVTMADLRLAVEQSKYGRSADLQRFISPGRKQRFAVMEASISLVATLLPAIEPVDFTTILPSVKSPIGRTVLKPNIGRYTTGMWTKRYLEEQLLVALAGRAGEEVVFGRDGMSSLQQSRNMLARQIASKMLNSGMSDHIDYANLRGLGNTWYDTSFEPGRFQTYTVTTDNDQTQSEWVDMDVEMEVRVNGSYEKVKAMIERNRMCLDLIVRLLLEAEKVSGDEIRAIVEGAADPADLEARKREAGVML